MIVRVNKAMSEQATATGQVSVAADSMRQQCEQAARATRDQARAMRDMASAAQNTSKQIKLISTSNAESSLVSGKLIASIGEVREITDRNIRGVRQTKGSSADLLRRAQDLASMFERPATTPSANGRASRPVSRARKGR